MSRSTALIALGLVVLIAPFLGLYGSLVALIEALAGLSTIVIGVTMRAESARRSRDAAPAPAVSPPSTEAAPPEEPHPSTIA